MINRRELFAKFKQREPESISPPYFSGEFDCVKNNKIKKKKKGE